jgi:hypothetical protein
MTTQDFIADASHWHITFDEVTKPLIEQARDTLVETLDAPPTREQVIAQLMMDNLFAHPCDPEAARDWPNLLTTEQKQSLVAIAGHMGPDWAQALYKAAVFITKVA